jgi:Spy/CpxP family protein refolding chaperone
MNEALKWKLAFAFLLVFVAGAATGAFFAIHLLRYHVILGPPHSGDIGDRMREHLQRTLGLTAEQESKIAPIVEATSAKLETIRVETAERVRGVMEESKKEVAPLLTPEQQKKLDQLETEHRKMMLHHGFLPPPPPPPKDKPPSPSP